MKWSRHIRQATDQASSTETKVILKIQVRVREPWDGMGVWMEDGWLVSWCEY